MFTKNQNLTVARIALILVLVAGIFGVVPVQASSEPQGEVAPMVDFLNPDGTLKLDGSASGSLDLQNWDVRIDDVRGLVFSQKKAESFSPLMATTQGEWSALGDNGAGNGALDGFVHAIAVSGTDVYVGGNFTNAGGNPKADYIAKWDGTTWSNLGDNGILPSENANGAVQGEVWSIGVNGSDVYVGVLGNVWIGGAPAASYVAKWNGANWSGLVGGDGTGNPLNTYPIAFAFIGTDVYVGGFFTNVKNGSTTLTEADYLAKWDGTNWSAVGNDGAGNGSLNNNVHALAAIGGYLVVGGNFTDVKDGATTLTAADYIAGWNGTNWSAFGNDGGSPFDGSIRGGTGVYDIEFVGEDIYVVGDFVNVNNKGMILNAADYIAKWDGLNWSALGSNGNGDGAIGNTIFRMAVNRNKLYVGGLFQNVNNNGSVLTAADYVAKWDGADWSALGNDDGIPLNGSLNSFGEGSVAANGENLFVGGQFTNVNNTGVVLNAADYVAAYGLCTTGPLTVQNTNDSGPGSLRQAITDSCPGGTINFDSSLSGGVIVLSSTIVIDTNLTIDGSSLSQHIVINGDTDGDGKGNVRVFDVSWYTVVSLIELDVVEGYAHSGGGILNQGELTVVNSNFVGNEAVFGGGAIYNVHKLTVQGSSFSKNRAYPTVINDPDGYGGAIYNIYFLNVTNSTFSLNNVYVKGGGIFNTDSGVATLVNNTLYMNGASSGGDLYSNSGTINLQNNIIGSCVNNGGAIGTDVYNIIAGNNGCGSPFWTGDPLLDDLRNNGGPTKTLALLPGSTAKDAIWEGDECPTVDQRGVTRPQGYGCDIGAYESNPKIRHVKWNATGLNNGSSWTDAFTDLQSALSAASSGDEIWVAAGTYLPTTTADQTVSFELRNGVGIYGGFAGTETIRSQRDFKTNVTVLSGDIGIDGDPANNSFRVVTAYGGNTEILDGFTISGGRANASSPYNIGGGLYNTNSPTLSNLVINDNYAQNGGGMYNDSGSNPTLTNVTFSNNVAVENGGGMYNGIGSIPKISDAEFVNNSSGNLGGGMYNLAADPVISSTTFQGNNATAQGGGMFNSNSSPSITNVVFDANSSVNGGGMTNISGSSPNLDNVTFTNNVATAYADSYGGGMSNQSSSPSLTGVIFYGNTAKYGGGMSNYPNSAPTLINVTFSGNTATVGGGVYNFLKSSPVLTNVTFSGNSAYSAGNDIANINNSNPVIRNSILYDAGVPIYNSSSTPMVTYSVVRGGYTGTGNLDSDPLLQPLTDNGGLTQTMALGTGSPAIDAADDATCPPADQRGVTRPQGSHCDIGAYETGASAPTFEWNTFQGAALEDSAIDIKVDSAGNIYITGYSADIWDGNPLAPAPIEEGMGAYVAKFDPNANLLWYTYIGAGATGNELDGGWAINLDESGNIYVLGVSYSTWGSNPVHEFVGASSAADVFVAKLNPNGALQWNTFLGGVEYDSPGGMVLDLSGNIYLTGMSETDWGATFPSPIRPFSGSYPDTEAFIAKLNASGVLQWHTFLGGVDYDYGNDVLTDTSGNIYTTGQSNATWGNSPIRSFSGETDAYVAKLDSYGNLLWNTFLGGSSGDWPYGLVHDSFGNIIISGASSTSWGAPLATGGGPDDAFLAKLDSDGVLQWNTFFGGTGSDYAVTPVVNLADNSIVLLGASVNTSWGNAPMYPYNLNGKYYLAQFSSNGSFQWNAFFGEPTFWGRMAQTLTIQNGYVLASGWSSVSWGDPIHPYSGSSDIYILKVNLHNAYPVVSSITRKDVDPNKASSVDFEVVFSEPVTGVSTDDLHLTNTGVTGAAIAGVTPVSGTTYTVTVNTGTGNGTIRLDVVDDDSIRNGSNTPLGGVGAGNGNFTGGETYTIVKTPTFGDVPDTYWAWGFIERLYNAGVTSGCSASPKLYCPAATVTRDQMAVFLLRGKHTSSYMPPTATGVFQDVPVNYWAADWIEQLAVEGITSGCSVSPKLYCPTVAVTRDQMAIFLLRAKYGSSYVPPPATGVFQDVPVNYWAADWIEQLAAEGITSGCSVTPRLYCPTAAVTRDQMAVFLVKNFNLP